MRGIKNNTLIDECKRLRVEQRLSLQEIHNLTGASKGSLSAWLTGLPLTEEEKALRSQERKRYVPPKKDWGEESDLHKMTTGQEMTRLQKGKIAEAAVMLRLVVQGMAPYGSVFDGDKTDWLVEVPKTNKVWKVQVKWVKSVHNISLQCTTGHNTSRPYLEGEFDFIVGYDLFTDTAYVWSWEDVKHLSTSISICQEAAERWDKLLSSV